MIASEPQFISQMFENLDFNWIIHDYIHFWCSLNETTLLDITALAFIKAASIPSIEAASTVFIEAALIVTSLRRHQETLIEMHLLRLPQEVFIEGASICCLKKRSLRLPLEDFIKATFMEAASKSLNLAFLKKSLLRLPQYPSLSMILFSIKALPSQLSSLRLSTVYCPCNQN